MRYARHKSHLDSRVKNWLKKRKRKKSNMLQSFVTSGGIGLERQSDTEGTFAKNMVRELYIGTVLPKLYIFLHQMVRLRLIPNYNT